MMRKCDKGLCRVMVAVVVLLSLVCAVSAFAQGKPEAPPAKPATVEKGGSAKTGPPQLSPEAAAQVEKYAACSPLFSAEQIAGLIRFVNELSPELPAKIRPILLKCDFNVNNRLLGLIEQIDREMGQAEFDDPEEEKLFLQEKAREIEVQAALLQESPDKAKIKQLVSELFELRQKAMKQVADNIEQEAAELKKRVEERQKNKDKIVEAKVKDLLSAPPPPTAQGPLSWD